MSRLCFVQKAFLAGSWRIFFLSKILSCKMAPTCRFRASTLPILDPALCSNTNSIFCPSFYVKLSSLPGNKFWFRASFFFFLGAWLVRLWQAFVSFQIPLFPSPPDGIGCVGDIFFYFDMPSFALGNYATVGAVCELFICLPLLQCTRLRAVSLFTYCENRECTMTLMSTTVYSGPPAIVI